jgi:hypothetical protein
MKKILAWAFIGLVMFILFVNFLESWSKDLGDRPILVIIATILTTLGWFSLAQWAFKEI